MNLDAETIRKLALIYIKSQDLTGKSPSEIRQLYEAAYAEIKAGNQKKDAGKVRY